MPTDSLQYSDDNNYSPVRLSTPHYSKRPLDTTTKAEFLFDADADDQVVMNLDRSLLLDSSFDFHIQKR